MPHIASNDFPGALNDMEEFWRDHCKWLDEEGYTLRPRYQPDWVPSWRSAGLHPYMREDGFPIFMVPIMDAVRKSDGKMVALKKIKKSVHPHEAEIGLYLSSPPLSQDPRNHCCPIYAVLTPPNENDLQVLVMPLLREHSDPNYTTVGEAVEFFRQAFEGIQFMHSQNIAHRDCQSANIMMDPSDMFPNLYHPAMIYMNLNMKGEAKYYTRTARPTKYYIIDFGLSRRYSPDEKNPLEYIIRGGDKTVPEFKGDPSVPINPFPTDVYYLGNMVRLAFMAKYANFDFMKPLIDDMVADDPATRPNMDEVVARLGEICSKLSMWKLRSRLVVRQDGRFINFLKTVQHVYRQASYFVMLRSPLPIPPRKR